LYVTNLDPLGDFSIELISEFFKAQFGFGFKKPMAVGIALVGDLISQGINLDKWAFLTKFFFHNQRAFTIGLLQNTVPFASFMPLHVYFSIEM
jgi:hypothetical protein